MIPFDATQISAAYSAFTGLIAGFAFAAMFLLVERALDAERDSVRQNNYFQSMTALFVAFICGSLASFLYAGIAADIPSVALGSFTVTSVILIMEIFSIFYGISVMFSVLGAKSFAPLVRHVSFVVILFATFRMFHTSMMVGEYLGPSYWYTLILYIAVGIPVLALILRLRPHWNPLKRLTGNQFLYSLLIASFGVGTAQTLFIGNRSQAVDLWIVAVSMIVVSFFAAWTIAILPADEEVNFAASE
jgi:hypothetical protein